MDPGSDPEATPRTRFYAPLPVSDPPTPVKTSRSCWRLCSLAVGATVALLLAASQTNPRGPFTVSGSVPISRGVSDGVSEKSTAALLEAGSSYPWTNAMLAWQRSGFHFQPPKNWMNDPNGPMYYKGWYHLFYQHNPDSAVWGNITWGHAVSRDLIRWRHLPIAMHRDRWYDARGVFSGSATVLPDDRVVVMYTGSTEGLAQVQNVAVPADPADPLLRSWVKPDANPVLFPPPGIGSKDFRDPTAFWSVGDPGSEPAWRVAIGSKNDSDGGHAGIVLVYQTKDFISYELLPGVMHGVAGTGMWECVDFYPVSTGAAAGLDNSARPGEGVKHVLKASLDDEKRDYYAIGEYDVARNAWVPDDVEDDVGVGLMVDYGKYYASKTFYDGAKGRRVVLGWIGEEDSERSDLLKGWASLHTIPREVLFDNKTGSSLLQWPVEEVESLRLRGEEFDDLALPPGSVLPLHVHEAVQLDIVAEFETDSWALMAGTFEAGVGYNCSTSGGATGRGALGPFGLLVLADEDREEQTAVYFYIGRGPDGGLRTFFCQDELRSTKAGDVVKRVYGSAVPVIDGENLTVRILVDHSVVESFAQGGRRCITSRVYPTKAIYGAARVFLFNNATVARVTARSVKIWQMSSADIRPYDEAAADALV